MRLLCRKVIQGRPRSPTHTGRDPALRQSFGGDEAPLQEGGQSKSAELSSPARAREASGMQDEGGLRSYRSHLSAFDFALHCWEMS